MLVVNCYDKFLVILLKFLLTYKSPKLGPDKMLNHYC